MNKCDFCELGTAQNCREYGTVFLTRDYCEDASRKLQDFIKELVKEGKVQISLN